MKIMKVLGVVVGIHVFALILIFANPGCSATTKPTPAPVDTVARADAAPSVSVTGVSPSVSVPMFDSSASPLTPAPMAFNPDAPALAANGGVRFSPTRPGTAAASTLVAEPVTDVLPATTYVVKSGDSLWTIAKKNKLTYQELAAANNLKATASLHEGQKLLIPSKAPTPAAAPATAMSAAKTGGASAATTSAPAAKTSSDSFKHVVKSGETLGTIAKKYDVKQGDIAVANNITDPQKIYLGMELVIPGYHTPGGKAATKAGTSTKGGSTAKPASTPTPTLEIKPIFTAPGSSPVIGPNAPTTPSTSSVPVIKVDETPAPPGKP